MIKPSIRLAPVIITLAVLAACGSDSGTGPPIGPDPDTATVTLTPQQRVAAISQMESQLAALTGAGLTGAALNVTMRAWLDARPEFEAAGIDDGSSSVWARFTDGRLLIIANNRSLDPDAEAEGEAVLRTALEANLVASDELPPGRRVRLLHSFGAGLDAGDRVIQDMAGMFTHAGYNMALSSTQDAPVDVLRNISGDAFFYINTHGGRGVLRDSSEMFAIQSSTLISEALEQYSDYDQDLRAGRLVYMTADNGLRDAAGNARKDTRYGITHLFVSRYMNFGPDGMVFINACYSGHSHADVAAFVNAVQSKGGRLYLGWDGVVSSDGSYRSARYFVDRMLGANLYRAEDPFQRPFDAESVLDDMRRKGLASDALTDLVLKLGPGAPTLLAPTIYGLQTLNLVDEMIIHGSFGSDPRGTGTGTVTVGGSPVSILSWARDRIRVAIPRSGPGAQGDVVVTTRGVRSNARALVAWRGRMRYTLRGSGSLARRIEFDLHLRGDPDQARTEAGRLPRDLPAEWGVQPILDATGTYSASGSYTFSYPGDPCTITDSWSGSGSFQFGPNPTGTSGMLYGGEVRSADREIRLFLVALGSHMMREVWGGECSGEPIDVPTGFTIAPEIFTGPGFVTLTMDNSYNIQAGRIEARVSGPFRPEMQSTATLEWDAITAQPSHAWTQKK